LTPFILLVPCALVPQRPFIRFPFSALRFQLSAFQTDTNLLFALPHVLSAARVKEVPNDEPKRGVPGKKPE
jgi:hypothetical protein